MAERTSKRKRFLFHAWTALLDYALAFLTFGFLKEHVPALAANNSEPFNLIIFFSIGLGYYSLTALILQIPEVKTVVDRTISSEPLEPLPKPQQQNIVRGLFVAFGIFLVVCWFTLYLPRYSPLQAMLSAPAFIIAYTGGWLAYEYKEFAQKYGAALIGLVLGIIVLDAFDDAPFLFCLLALAVPSATGHLIGNWWNSQSFVRQARARKQREEEEQRATEQQEAREARMREHIDATEPIAPKHRGLSREAQKLADDIDKLF